MNMTNDELVKEIGAALKATRMSLNLPQRIVAARSAVSISAVKHLEAGTGATVLTLVAVARTLNKISWIRGLAPSGEISPIELMDNPQSLRPRQRARLKRKAASNV